MGIYSEDRTMLTVDPDAESKVMEGYSSINDLYSIMEDSIHDDAIIYNAIIESMASVLMLDEADGAKADKRANTICKVAAANSAKLAKAIAKNKSVCASSKEMMDNLSKAAEISLSKYKDNFERNKDIASSPRFTIKYNKEALHCPAKDLEKFAANAGKSLKDIASNCVNIASKNTKEINKNKNNVFKVSALEKYADDFCICKKETKVQGNPFTDGYTVNKLVKDISDTSSAKKSLDKFNADATKALEVFTNNMNKLCDKVKSSKAGVTQEDIEIMYALTALSTNMNKVIVHTTKDIFNAYRAHLNACLRVYVGVSKLKAVRVVKEAAEPTKDDVLKEEIEAVKNDDNLENSKKIEGEFEDDLEPVANGDIEKEFNSLPEDETKKDEGIDPVKPSDVPMNDGSAHEAAEPTIDPPIDFITEEDVDILNSDDIDGDNNCDISPVGPTKVIPDEVNAPKGDMNYDKDEALMKEDFMDQVNALDNGDSFADTMNTGLNIAPEEIIPGSDEELIDDEAIAFIEGE